MGAFQITCIMVPLLIMATSLVSEINTRVALVKGWVNSFLALMGQLYFGFYIAVLPQTREILGSMAQEPFVRISAPEGEQRHQRIKRQERETDVWMRQVQSI